MSGPRPCVSYLCLQATREGQASHAHVHEIVDGLIRRGWKVSLFEPFFAGTTRPLTILERLWGFASTQARLLRQRDDPSILYVRSHFAAFPAALVARLRHVYVLQEVNGPYEDLFASWPWTRKLAGLFKWLYRMQLKWADAIIVVTPGLKEWVTKEAGNRPVYVIANGANVELFRPDAPCEYSLRKPYALFFGALAPWQGIDTLIEAVKHPEWPEGLQLVVVGDGVKRLMVEAAAKCSAAITLLGVVPYQQMPGIVANSMVSLIPKNDVGNRSSTGLSPLKLFESMACGVPVVVTDFPGQAELVIEHGCGIVIPPNAPRALAQAVAHLCSNATVRVAMGNNGRKAIVREHSWDNRVSETESVLLSVLRGTAGNSLEDNSP